MTDLAEVAGTPVRGAPPGSVDPEPTDFELGFRSRAWWILSFGVLLSLSHAFVPLEEFVHRGDDAYYYFKLATNYHEYGFWTFDGLRPSNGVQPLWGVILTAAAQVMHWVGIEDLDVMSRVFVSITALFHFAAAMVLLHLVGTSVSLAAGIAACGAALFPLGIVWTRVWGMENSLYALVLLSTVLFYHRRFRREGTVKQAIKLGALLGILTLSRLNAGFLIPIMLGMYLFFSGRHGGFAQRFKLCWFIGGVATLIIVPYLAYNISTTDHMLPVAGEAKKIRAALYLEANDIDTVWSQHFFEVLDDWTEETQRWFVTSRAMDGTWITGGRLAYENSTPYSTVRWFLAGFLLLPFLVGKPRAWLAALRRMCAQMKAFGYLLLFCLLNMAVSLMMFPYEATYSIKRWWLLESEILIATTVAVLAGTSLAFVGSHWIAKNAQKSLATMALLLLVGLSAYKTIDFYWDGEVQYPDWNISTNEERYAASIWLRDNVPDEAIVGSWNAGVIGYYADCHVINLDGLINSWEFLPYLAKGDLANYCRDFGLDYIADTNFEINYRAGKGLIGALNMKRVYHHYMDPLDTGLSYKDQAMLVFEIGTRESGPGRELPGAGQGLRGLGGKERK
ncbi:MAG: hypothetical protein ACI9EF_002695 [Pseudohongiellaceae bacterium]|jgi:hypothetical protein